MVAATEFKYRELEDIELPELAQVLELLKDVGISPRAVLAYATAVEVATMPDDSEMTVEEAFEIDHEEMGETLGDEVFSDARLCLIKMNKIKAH